MKILNDILQEEVDRLVQLENAYKSKIEKLSRQVKKDIKEIEKKLNEKEKMAKKNSEKYQNLSEVIL